jgi:hypothetical protein
MPIMESELKTSEATRRSRTRIAAALAVSLLLAGGGVAWYGGNFHRHGAGEQTAGEQYTCGMHPWIITDKPGDCPICGMKLVKMETTGGALSTLPGLATVQIDPARQQLIGLRTTEVSRGPVGESWRTVGKVAVAIANSNSQRVYTMIETGDGIPLGMLAPTLDFFQDFFQGFFKRVKIITGARSAGRATVPCNN